MGLRRLCACVCVCAKSTHKAITLDNDKTDILKYSAQKKYEIKRKCVHFLPFPVNVCVCIIRKEDTLKFPT